MRTPRDRTTPTTPAGPAARPTAAERVRSVLAAAHSMTVVTDGLRTEVRHLDDGDPMGRLHLHHDAALPGDDPRPAVRLEFTDVAPTPVRDRVRARVTLLGRLLTPYTEEPGGTTCVAFGRAVLETAEGTTYLTPAELEAAEPDPLATYEAGMLTHLLDDHPELVTLLLRLVHPQPGATVLRALPVALDRHGITLRLEERRGHRDATLAFPSPVADVERSGAQIQALLSKARRLSHRNTLPA
ncbi:DUF2470 domain-containing protein [Streptomyces antimicrobicus]|uniref:DUF2470 domain-containing protein n=1 Tax=Streptomyces antimicrobicus TaxID=2883108 RepID=A0ABS8BA31_9ACTN|nr:DUF2470 domain-containing protein [Streptomyces antimicrobicus]MCB5181462.1 DUF2470 domain-containing protein [Streptomyces antimicrobicus]